MGKELAVPQKLNTKLPNDWAIPHPSVYPKEPKAGFQGDICTPIVTAMTEDEMVGCHRWLDGHEFEQTWGDGDGQGSCSPWDRKVGQDWVTELNWTQWNTRDSGWIPRSGRSPWRRAWQSTPVFLPGESPWTEEPGGVQSIGSQRVRHNWSDLAHTHTQWTIIQP